MAKNVVTKIILEAERRGNAAFKGVEADLKKVAGAAALAGAAAAAALAAVTKRSFEQIDLLGKTSELLGANTREFAALGFAANITGNATNKFNIGVQRMTRRVAEAATGTGEAAGAIRELGLDAEALTKLPLEQQFVEVSRALAAVEGQATKVRIGFKLFDSEGVALLRTAEMVARDGLGAITAEAERLGLALGQVDVAQVEEANDAMLRAAARVQGIGNVVAVNLAPVITALGNSFAMAGGDAEVMGERVNRVIDGIAVGVGMIGDAFHGWRLIFKTVEISALFLSEGIVRNLHTVERASIAAQNAVRRLFDLEEIDPSQSQLFILADSLSVSREEAAKMLSELAAAEKPSERIAAALQQARINAHETAAGIARAREQAIAAAPDINESEIAAAARERAEEAAAREREAMQKQLETIDVFLATKQEREALAFLKRQEIVDQALEAEVISAQRANSIKLRLQHDLQARLTALDKEGWTDRQKFVAMSTKAQTAAVLDSLVEMTQGVATTNKTMFKLNKVAAIARAVINVSEGVTKALSAYPPPLSFAMAAAQAAAGAAQIAAIRSASFGGGTTPSIAGSAPTLNSQPVIPLQSPSEAASNAGTVVNVTVTGIVGTIDRSTATAIGEAIADVVEHGDVQIMSPQSRNAKDLVEAAG